MAGAATLLLLSLFVILASRNAECQKLSIQADVDLSQKVMDMIQKLNDDRTVHRRSRRSINQSRRPLHRSQQPQKFDVIFLDEPLKYMARHLRAMGPRKIQHLSTHVAQKFGIPRGDSTLNMLTTVAQDDFTKAFDEFYNDLKESYHSKTKLDKERIVVYLVFRTNEILGQKSRSLADNLYKGIDTHIALRDQNMINTNIKNEMINHLRSQLRYMCSEVRICCFYPGFSDFVAEAFREILLLPEENIGQFIIKLTDVIWKMDSFTETIIKEDIRGIIGTNLLQLTQTMNDIKEFLNNIRKIILNRRKFDPTQRDARTIAVGLVLDILDKGFADDGEKLIALDFDLLTQALKNWRPGLKRTLDSVMESFGEHFEKTLSHSLTPNAKDELKALTETIVTSEIGKETISANLFVNGSSFVSGKDLFPPLLPVNV